MQHICVRYMGQINVNLLCNLNYLSLPQDKGSSFDILSISIDFSKQGYPDTLDTYGMVSGVINFCMAAG